MNSTICPIGLPNAAGDSGLGPSLPEGDAIFESPEEKGSLNVSNRSMGICG